MDKLSLFNQINWSASDLNHASLVFQKGSGALHSGCTTGSSSIAIENLEELGRALGNPQYLESLYRGKSAAQMRCFSKNVEQLSKTVKGAQNLYSHFLESKEEAQAALTRTQQDAAKYGNKAANLMLVQRHLHDLPGVDIPDILPLNHQEIEKYLKAHSIDLEAIIEQARALDLQAGQTHCPAARSLLKQTEKKIEAVFSKSPLVTPALSRWIEKAQTQDVRIMVRSSGLEDSDENPNAGANRSIVGVEADTGKISTAIGQVVASYMSEKSVVQSSLVSGEDYTIPMLPVLLQVMVGESPNQANPSFSSGVLFTTEPEGAYDPLVQVQSSFGHGEGVVTSAVACDTYYFYPGTEGTLTTHSVIRPKQRRAVCTQEGSAVRYQDNPKDYHTRDSLPLKVHERMYQVASRMRELYGQAMDIEWAYDQKEDILYIVQARPLQKRSDATPSYLRIRELAAKVTPGKLIVASGSQVQAIASEREVLIAPNLSAALEEYIRLPENLRAQVKGVVTQQWAAATSHEATTFRGESIPVLWVKDTQRIQGALETEQLVLLDPQQELLAVTARNTDIDGFIQEGWKNYPIAKAQSLRPLSRVDVEALQQNLERLAQGGKLITNYAETLDALADFEQPPRVRQALSDLMYTLIHLAQSKGWSEGLATKELLYYASEAGVELHNALVSYSAAENPEQREQQYKALLLAKRWLESVLTQETTTVVDGNSFQSFFEELHMRRRVETVWAENAPEHYIGNVDRVSVEEAQTLLAHYLSLQPALFNPHAARQFNEFVVGVAVSRNRKVLGSLNTLIKYLEKRGLLAEFLNRHFAPAWEGARDAKDCLRALGMELQKIDQTAERFSELQQNLSRWEATIPNWSDEAAFEELYQGFAEELAPFMLGTQLIDSVKDSQLSELERGLAAHLALRLLDCMDRSIKSLKGGVPYSVALKLERFVQLLKPYHAMMEQWMHAIPDETLEAWSAKIPQHSRVELTKRLEMIREVFEARSKTHERQELFPSGALSIDSCTIGSGANFGRQFATHEHRVTLEDLFSLMHQNSLRAISTTVQKKNETLPAPIQTVIQQVSSVIDSDLLPRDRIEPQLISIETQGYPELQVNYNIGLLHHSALARIEYDCISGEMSLKLDLFEEPSRGHNQALPLYALLESTAQGLEVRDLRTQRQTGHTTMTWKLDSDKLKTQLASLKPIWNTLLISSFGQMEPIEEAADQLKDICLLFLDQDTNWWRACSALQTENTPGVDYSMELLLYELCVNSEVSGNVDRFCQILSSTPTLVPFLWKARTNWRTLVKDSTLSSESRVKVYTASRSHAKLLWKQCAKYRSWSEIDLLIKAGVSCDIELEDGRTPLMLCIERGAEQATLFKILEETASNKLGPIAAYLIDKPEYTQLHARVMARLKN